MKVPFFRVSVAIAPGHYLLTVRYHKLFGSGFVYSIEFFFSPSLSLGGKDVRSVRYYVHNPTFEAKCQFLFQIFSSGISRKLIFV
jgi:hypothetical protein